MDLYFIICTGIILQLSSSRHKDRFVGPRSQAFVHSLVGVLGCLGHQMYSWNTPIAIFHN
jgi:hypothetical protein